MMARLDGGDVDHIVRFGDPVLIKQPAWWARDGYR